MGTRSWLNSLVGGRAGYPGVVPLGQLLLGRAPEEVEEWSYGNSPFKDKPISGIGNLLPELQERRIQQVADALMLTPLMPEGKAAGAAGAALSNFRKLLPGELPPGLKPVFRGTRKINPAQPPESYSPRARMVFSSDNPLVALTYTPGPGSPHSSVVSGGIKPPELTIDALGEHWNAIPTDVLPRGELQKFLREMGIVRYASTDDIADALYKLEMPSIEIQNVVDLAADPRYTHYTPERLSHPEMKAFKAALRQKGLGRVAPIIDQPNTVYIARPEEYVWRNW